MINCQAVGVSTVPCRPTAGAAPGGNRASCNLGKDRYIVENMRLEERTNRGAVATVVPLNIVGAPETPACLGCTARYIGID